MTIKNQSMNLKIIFLDARNLLLFLLKKIIVLVAKSR